ncbi:integral membrane protein [Colletotrichum cereale]|nr:integral membrane protein [Colletotrichum cereale]
MSHTTENDAVEVMPEVRAEREPIVSSRKLTVRLGDDICVSHGGNVDVLTIRLNRTIRVPDNRDTNDLPPSMGTFPLFKVRDYARRMPEDMAKKGGIFFPMYQREAMWISFSSRAPFAIKLYVGGVNAVSGFPMTENDKTREKRLKMLSSGHQLQDYIVLPEQNWLDGIVSEDGKIRQFVAQPKGSGFSVEAQVTGDEKVGGIQIELIPIKKNLPAEFDVRYQNRNSEVVTRTFNLAERGLAADSTWGDVKKLIHAEFDIAVEDQVLSDHGSKAPFRHFGSDLFDFSDDTKLGDAYFPPKFSTLSGNMKAGPDGAAVLEDSPSKRTKSESSRAAPPQEVKEMGLAAGGLIKQTIEADTHPADVWDVEASLMMNIQILDVESFCVVTGQPAPDTPVDAQSYAHRGYPFFEIWGEEKSGIKGDFAEVRSVAQIEAERARAEGKDVREEESVPMRVVQLGHFKSTFRPVDLLREELEGLELNG